MPHMVWSKSDSRERHLHRPDSTINTPLAISKGILGYGIKFWAIWFILYGTSWLWVSILSVQSLKLLPTNSHAGHPEPRAGCGASTQFQTPVTVNTCAAEALLSKGIDPYLLKQVLCYEWYWVDLPSQEEKNSILSLKLFLHCHYLRVTLETVVWQKLKAHLLAFFKSFYRI